MREGRERDGVRERGSEINRDTQRKRERGKRRKRVRIREIDVGI